MGSNYQMVAFAPLLRGITPEINSMRSNNSPLIPDSPQHSATTDDPPSPPSAGSTEPSLEPLETESAKPTPTALPEDGPFQLCTHWRHSHWWQRRERLINALRALQHNSADAVYRCGFEAHVVKSDTEPVTYALHAQCCHSRWCEPCQRTLRTRVAQRLQDLFKQRHTSAMRLLTLTLRSSPDPLGQQVDRLYAAFKRFRNSAPIKRAIAGGIWFLEVTYSDERQQWHPHLHVLFDGRFLPHQLAQDYWFATTGDSYIINLKLLPSQKAVSYCAKYLGKCVPGKIYNSHALLCDAIAGLDGRKTYGTFGSWRQFQLFAKPDHTGVWLTVAPLWVIITRARTGDRDARLILNHLTPGNTYPPPEAGPSP